MIELSNGKHLLDEIYRRSIQSEPKAVINHVKYNCYDYAMVFTEYIAGEEFEEFELAGEHYFITLIATYGSSFDGSYNTKYKEVFEVDKDEGNRIYVRTLKTKSFEGELI